MRAGSCPARWRLSRLTLTAGDSRVDTSVSIQKDELLHKGKR
jgi:hypothetical protein